MGKRSRGKPLTVWDRGNTLLPAGLVFYFGVVLYGASEGDVYEGNSGLPRTW